MHASSLKFLSPLISRHSTVGAAKGFFFLDDYSSTKGTFDTVHTSLEMEVSIQKLPQDWDDLWLVLEGARTTLNNTIESRPN